MWEGIGHRDNCGKGETYFLEAGGTMFAEELSKQELR